MRSRRAGRVIVRDHAGAVLLCHAVVGGEGFWFTPGGGTGRDETARDAAARELHEETGITVVLDNAPVLHRRAQFTFLDEWTEQVESFWLATVDPRPHLVAHHLEDYEADSLDEWRWWAHRDLADLARREHLYPDCLPALLDHVDAADTTALPWLEEHVGNGTARVVRGLHAPAELPDWARRP